MNLTRFREQPVHRYLLSKAVELLREDPRVEGLYVSGSPHTDDYSDIDLMILSSEENRRSLEAEKREIASQVGELMAEAMAMVPHTYVVVYRPGVKMDYCFHLCPENPRPDKALIDIVYDPKDHLAELVAKSREMTWEIDVDELRNRVQHYYVTFSYTVAKLERGELWEARDCAEYHRQILITFEDILARRKGEGYRRLEQKLSQEKLALLRRTIPTDVTRRELARCIDLCREYFDTKLKHRLSELGAHPDAYAENMTALYEEGRSRVLELP